MPKIVIVGAGFAGISAARELVGEGVDDVVVLEARDRIGGRTKHGQIAGVDIDLGGMWMGPSQTRLKALAEHYGIDSYPTNLDGLGVFKVAGRERFGEREDYEPLLSAADKVQYLWLIRRIDALSKQLDIEEPWNHPRAAELDSTTVEHWIRSNLRSSRLISILQMACLSLFCAEASQISLLFFLHYVKSGDGLDVLISGDEGGAQNFLFDGGLHSIGRLMADELGERLHLSEPVTGIDWSEDRATVRTAENTYQADKVIVAVPPTLVQKIEFHPFLPQQRQRLNQRLEMGSAIKYWIAYDRPFWREQGFNGMVIRDDVPCSPCFDVTPPNTDLGIIAGFFDAEHAVQQSGLGSEERREIVTSMLVDHFGSEAKSPKEYVDVDWSATEWSNGCYGNFAPPGVYKDYASWLRKPIGPIHWAGTETSSRWTGYVEGAIRSGERAAIETIRKLRTE